MTTIRCVGLLCAAACVATVAAEPLSAQAQREILACYDAGTNSQGKPQGSGLVYRINVPGVVSQQSCVKSTDVQFSWTTKHGALTGLGEDSHPQYLLADGTRALTGSLSASGNKITGLAAGDADGDAVRFEQAIKMSDTARGDLAGLFPNPTVVGLHGRPLAFDTPLEGHVLTWNGTAWAPGAPAGGATGTPDNVPGTLVQRDATTGGFAAGPVTLDGGFLVRGVGGAPIPAEGRGERLMWHPGKAAIRAGDAQGDHWDDANVGVASAAFGRVTTASGTASFAMGSGTTASGGASFAMGSGGTTASGGGSTAIGSGARASGDASVAMGSGTIASGPASTALGFETGASGERSTAMGSGTTASGFVGTAMGYGARAEGDRSVAMGVNAVASGSFTVAMGHDAIAGGDRSTAMGWATHAAGPHSTAMGAGTIAAYSGSLATGSYNVHCTDCLFQVGKGTDGSHRSDALMLVNTGDLLIAGKLFDESSVSDIRLKEDVEPLEPTLDRVRQLVPIRYRLREGTGHPHERTIGLSAQAVEPLFPELVNRRPDGYLSLAYGELSAVLVRAIQEQQEQIETLRAELAALRAEMAHRSR